MFVCYFSLEFDYYLQCDQDFYGYCDRYCHPDPDKYACDSSGSRVCNRGRWYEHCKQCMHQPVRFWYLSYICIHATIKRVKGPTYDLGHHLCLSFVCPKSKGTARLRICAGSSEPLLFAFAISIKSNLLV